MSLFPRLAAFKILAVAYQGRHSTLYRAQANTGHNCAIKVFRRNQAQPEHHNEIPDLFLRELEVLSISNHPNLIRLLEFGCTLDTGEEFLALEWLEGQDFISASKRATRREFCSMITQVCRALAYIHRRGIAHGDLKPQNLLVIPSSGQISNSPTVKLIDFGLSSPLLSSQSTRLHGSPHYMAPEVIQGTPQTIASDLYSFGVVLYESLSGTVPFRGKDLSEILLQHIQVSAQPLSGDTATEFDALVQQLISKEPTRRPSSSAEVHRMMNGPLQDSFSPLHTSETWQALISTSTAPVRRQWEATYRQFIGTALAQGAQGPPYMIFVIGDKGSGKTRLLRDIGMHARTLGLQVYMHTAPAAADIHATSVAALRPGSLVTGSCGIAICLDDCDSASLCAINAELLQDCSRTHPLLWVISLNTLIMHTSLSSIIRSDRAITLSLDAFSRSDIASVLSDSLSLEAIQPPSLDYLCRESGGSPSLLAQVSAAALDQEVLVINQKTLMLGSTPERLTIPDSLAHELQSRLATLIQHDRHILVLLAVAIDSLDSLTISHLTGIDPLVARRRCEDLVRQGLIRVHGHDPLRFGSYSQLHARILLSGVSDVTLQDLHTRLADWYRQQPETPSTLERLVLHYSSGGAHDDTQHYAIIAARTAEANKDYRAASKYYGVVLQLHALDHTTVVSSSLGQANALMRLGRLREASALLDNLRQDHTLDQIEQYQVAIQKSRIADHGGDMSDMERSARAALAIASEAGMPAGIIMAMSLLGTALCGLQRSVEGLPLLYTTLAKARSEGNKEIIGDVLFSIAKYHWTRGNYSRALAYQRRSAPAHRSCGKVAALLQGEMNIGIVQSDLGLYHKARRSLLRSLESAPQRDCMAFNNIGDTYRAQGRWKLALASFKIAATASIDSGAKFTALTVDYNKAHVLIGTGHYSAAVSFLEHRIPRFRAIGSNQGVCSLYATWASLFLATARLEQGARTVTHAIHLAEASELMSSLLELKTLHAMILLRAGRLQQSHQVISSAISALDGRSPMEARMMAGIAALQIGRAIGLTCQECDFQIQPLLLQTRKRRMARFTTWALILRGEVLLEAGKSDEAESDLVEAAKISQKNADRPQFWMSSYWLGRVFEQRLQYERALRSYRVAALTVNELAMDIDDDRYREPFLAQPEVREVQARFERLRNEVGRKARHDIASMSRSEKISRRMLNALNAIGQKLTSILDLDDLLTNLLDLSIENVRAERGMVFLLDETAGEMRLACARNMDKESLEEVSSFSTSVIKRVAEGHTLLEVDVGKDPALSAFQSLVIHEIKSILCVPMRTRGKTVGVIYLDTRRAAQMFTDKERTFIESFASQAAIAIENARIFGDINAENSRLKREAAGKGRFENLIGTSPAMMRLSDTISGVMGSDCNVLISGESGTGKELVAKAIHYNGPRQTGKFVAIDCGALPESLLEAELFGFARGAFTGADRDKAGLIEESHGGTLFLDEITNTSVALQAKLLRVLQEHEVRRLGENSSKRVDARIIAATNANITALMRDGKFRSDLYYRLNVVTIDVPPLRDRREDIPLLVEHFLRQRSPDEKSRKRLAPGVVEALGHYDWPGNVRELENVVERLLVLARGQIISQNELPESIRASAGLRDVAAVARNAALDGGNNGPIGLASANKTGEQMLLEDALRRFGGDKAKAARFIGWNRQKLYRKMKGFGIPADYGRTV